MLLGRGLVAFLRTKKATKPRPYWHPIQFKISFYFSASASISQRTPFGRSFTATQLRAGLDTKYFA